MKGVTRALVVAVAVLSGLILCLQVRSAAAQQMSPDLDAAVMPVEPEPVLSKSVGDWLWLDASGGVMDDGVSIIRSSPVDANLMFAGGPGYVARSTDHGLSWHIVLTFDDAGMVSGERAVQGEDEDYSHDEQLSYRVQFLREYLQDELEKQFGTQYADSLMDQITDGDLELAEDADALEPLSDLMLDMDTDFNSVIEQELLNGEEERGPQELDPEMGYADRVTLLSLGGMPLDEAHREGADPQSLWDVMFSADGATVYTVTASGLFISNDRGVTWRKALLDMGDERLLSFAQSTDARLQVLGLTDGISISLDGGISWSRIVGAINGGVYGLWLSPSESRIYALSTSGLYSSVDRGSTWSAVSVPAMSPNDLRKLVFVGQDSDFFVLAQHDVFVSRDGGNSFLVLDTTQLGQNAWRDLVVINNSMDTLALMSDRGVYILMGETWLEANNGLLGQELYSISLDSISGAQHLSLWLATSIGLYMGLPGEMSARNAERFLSLQKQWKAEPATDLVLNKAMQAHHLSDLDEDSWKVRAGTSMLLPRVEFAWRYEQKKMDRDYEYFQQTSPEATKYFRYLRETKNEWRVMAYWDFTFDKFEKTQSSVRLKLNNMRNQRRTLLKSVLGLLQRRKALQIKEISRKKPNTDSIIKSRLAISEIEARLHYLTGGFYLNAIAAARNSGTAAP